MSKIIDERVVSMQFDNQKFEQAVQVTLSTLDKLKSKLNFEGAAKGLDNINNSIKKVDMSGMAKGIDNLHVKFSALDVMAVTALTNITNAAMRCGKQMISSLTIKPISQGFHEYELKMDSVKTIMAGTGESLETVQNYLDELNTYADKTIYSFSDMTTNIGKFTNSGVKLKDAVKAIQGISNEAALSGANANEASRAMYNFAQALSAGYVKLIDWKSIENANMATVEFKNELLKTAVALGTVKKVEGGYITTTKDANGKVSEVFNATKNFNDALSHQWMTTDVLVQTLGRYSDETTDIGKKAYAAAQDVTTFSKLMDTLAEAAGSGWARTWEIIIGDYNEAKEVWTSLSNFFSGVINGMSDARNNFLEGALSSKWNDFTKLINDAGLSTEKFEEQLKKTAKEHNIDLDQMIKDQGSLKKVIDTGKISKDLFVESLDKISAGQKKTGKSTEELSKKLSKFQTTVKDIWNSKDYRNQEERVQALIDKGYKYSDVQSLVKDTLKGQKVSFENLSYAQLKSLGYTNKEIDSLRLLANEAKKTGTPINELIDSMGKATGRELLIDSVKNIFQPIITIINSIKEAWANAFPSNPDFLYNIIDFIHDFTEHLVISKDAADKLTRTLKGVFAILDMVTMVVGGGFKIAFQVVSKIISEFWKALGFANVGILDITATIGDGIVAVRDWIESHNILFGAIETGVPLLVKLGQAVANFVQSIYKIPAVQNGLQKVSDAFGKIGAIIDKYFTGAITKLTNFINEVSSMDNLTLDNFYDMLAKFRDDVLGDLFSFDGDFSKLGTDIVDGLLEGLKAGGQKIKEAITNVAQILMTTFTTLLGIHSPSTTFKDYGMNIVEGLCNGVKAALSFVKDAFTSLVSTIGSVFEGIDIVDIYIMGSTVGIGFLLKKLLDIATSFKKPFDNVAKVIGNVGNVINSFSKYIDAKSLETKSQAMYNIAKAIGILAASLFVLSQLNQENLWSAVGAIGAVTAVMAAMMFVVKKLESASAIDMAKISVFTLSVSGSLLILSAAIRKLSEIDPSKATNSLIQLGAMVAGLTVLLYAYGKFVKADASNNIDKAGKMILKISVGLAIMALIMKLIGGMSDEDISKGINFVSGFTILIGLIIAVSKFAGAYADKAGKMMLKMSVSIGILALVIKSISALSVGDILKGITVIGALEIFFAGFVILSAIAGPYANIAGSMMLKMSVAIGILALSMKTISGLSVSDVSKGIGFITAVGILFALFIDVSTMAGENASKAGNMLLKMSVAMGIMALSMKIISTMSTHDIGKGILTISLIGTLFLAFIKVSNISKYASKAGSMILKMSAAIAIMAVATKVIAKLSIGDIAKGMVFVSAFGVFIQAMIKVSKHAGKYADKAGDMLLKMSGAIMVMVAAIAILSLLDPKEIAVGTVALSALMGMFAILIAASKNVPDKKVIGTLATLTVAIGLLGGIIYLLAGLPADSVLSVGASLSMMMLSLSAALRIIGASSGMSTKAMVSIGELTVIVGALGAILYILKDMPVESTFETAKSLSVLLLSLSASCVILSGVGALGGSAYAGIGALVTMVTALGALMVAIGGLVTYIPDLETFLDKGIDILSKIGEGIGSFVGSIVNGVLKTSMEGLPTVAKDLSNFMIELKPFLDGAKSIDTTAMNNVSTLAGTILTLTATKLLDGIASFVAGGSSLTEFANELKPFGEGLVQFSKAVSGKIDTKAVNSAANAGKIMANLNASIPRSGGLLQELLGTKDLSKFGQQMKNFGTALVEFSKAVSEKGINIKAVDAAANAGKIMSELAGDIPTTGGLLQVLMGTKDLSKFGQQMKNFGTALVEFSKAVSEKGINEKAVDAAYNAGQLMKNLAVELPSDGGLLGFIFGNENISLSDFGKQLADFGGSLSTFSSKTSSIDVDKFNGVISGVGTLSDVIVDLQSIDTDSISNLADAVDQLADANFKGFVNNLAGIDSSKLAKLGSGISDSIASSIKNKAASISSAFTNVIMTLMKNISGFKANFTKCGNSLATGFSEGLKKGSANVGDYGKKMAESVLKAIKDKNSEFTKAGKNAAEGFANGISKNTYLATAKARAMAKAASDAAKKALDENSPSKVFYKIGDFAGKGFINSLHDYQETSYKAGFSIGDNAREGINNSIQKIGAIMSNDIDVNPTIRPVVDMSDVNKSARNINSLLSLNPSVDMDANIKSISSSMRNRNQNGTTNDVVNAINKLGKSLGSVGGDTYNVNGVSYEEASDVADALKTIIKAAKVERRK